MSSSPSASDIASLASTIAAALCRPADTLVRGNEQDVAKIVESALRENFRVEAEIEAAAEQALADLGAAASGMDRGKLLVGLRERIAKKRGFVL